MFKLKLIATAALLSTALTMIGQVKGNYDYRANSSIATMREASSNQNYGLINMPALGDLTFSIKGLYNAPADSYLAIFTSTQVGETQREANDLLRAKIDSIRSGVLRKSGDVEMFVDMISFVPLYETQAAKKIFSKTTYNEIPIGFELKKNLHFKYSDPKVLEYLVTICAENEIYDLVRVDYFIEDIDKKKDKMIMKAEGMMKQKISRIGEFTNEDYKDKDRQMTEGFLIHLPHEQYQSYTVFSSNAMYVKQSGAVNAAPKSTSQFYMPKFNKNYDFVLNPAMLEPVVQIEYEVKMRLIPKPEKPKEKKEPKEVVKEKIEKQIFWVTPTGDIKQLNF
ncbi:hypothetical protein [Owenweeksia hongkongensis]|uniref:hypothetical protein n=1 Tax=Owenweeksia hongkongensis TaxID=253245 RepID=UPI003A94EE1E